VNFGPLEKQKMRLALEHSDTVNGNTDSNTDGNSGI
jgi:hypothetical protein